MKPLASYATYEEANGRQLDLLAAGIDASVEYAASAGMVTLSGVGGLFHLLVNEEDHPSALEIITPALDPGVKSIAACPRCDGGNIRETEVNALLDVCTLMLPSMIGFVAAKFSGTRFYCSDCRTKFRKCITGA